MLLLLFQNVYFIGDTPINKLDMTSALRDLDCYEKEKYKK